MASNAHDAKVLELVREPLQAAQARFCEMEKSAQKLLKGLRQDWNLVELRSQVAKLQSQGVGRAQDLREQGLKRAQELRARAQALRADAAEKLELWQGKAVAFLGVASRDQVEDLSKDLARLARRLDKIEKARKEAKVPARSSVGV